MIWLLDNIFGGIWAILSQFTDARNLSSPWLEADVHLIQETYLEEHSGVSHYSNQSVGKEGKHKSSCFKPLLTAVYSLSDLTLFFFCVSFISLFPQIIIK